jgi:hypothetical protein
LDGGLGEIVITVAESGEKKYVRFNNQAMGAGEKTNLVFRVKREEILKGYTREKWDPEQRRYIYGKDVEGGRLVFFREIEVVGGPHNGISGIFKFSFDLNLRFLASVGEAWARSWDPTEITYTIRATKRTEEMKSIRYNVWPNKPDGEADAEEEEEEEIDDTTLSVRISQELASAGKPIDSTVVGALIKRIRTEGIKPTPKNIAKLVSLNV